MTSVTTDRRFGLNASNAIKSPVRAASLTALTFSGLSTVDGVALNAGDRVLQNIAGGNINNGIWIASTGTWTRDLDFDDQYDVVEGTIVPVVEGTTNGNTCYRVTTTGAIQPGTTAIAFTKALFGGSVSGSTFLQGGTGAINRDGQAKMRDVFAAPDFGTLGDGVTDETTFFQNGINAVQSTIGAMLFIPPNQSGQYYKITSSLSITKSCILRGSGANTTTFIGTGLGAGNYLFNVDGTVNPNLEFVEISDMQLRTDGIVASLVQLKNVANSKMSNVQIRNALNGIVLSGNRGFSLVFDKVVHTGGISASCIRYSSFTGGAGHTFRDCLFGGSDAFVVDGTSTIRGLTFLNTLFESCTSTGVTINGTVEGWCVSGGHSEAGSGGNTFSIYPSAGNVVNGFAIQGFDFRAGSETNGILLGGNGGTVRGFSITGNKFFNYIGAAVKFNGDGQSGVIAGNQAGSCNNFILGTIQPGVMVSNNELNGTRLLNNTFTPTDASGAGLVFTTAAGFFQQIGNLVMWQAEVVFPVTANAATVVIGGLPQVVAGGPNQQGRAGITINVTDSVAVGALYIEATQTLHIYKAGLVLAINSDLSNKTLYLSGIYSV